MKQICSGRENRKTSGMLVSDTSASDPYIVMVSTPAGPGSLFYKIEAEPEDTCIYRRLKFDYTYGLTRSIARKR